MIELNIIKEYIPIELKEEQSGEKVFDWEIPNEWNIKDAYIKSPTGEKLIDFKECNLHVLSYSIPVHKKISLTRPSEFINVGFISSFFCDHVVSKLFKNWIIKLNKDKFKTFVYHVGSKNDHVLIIFVFFHVQIRNLEVSEVVKLY